MPTAKARYKGDGAGQKPRDFSDRLEATLRSHYPDQNAESDPVFGHPADAFVEEVLAEARGALSRLHWDQFDLTKQEIRAEQADLLKTLKDGHEKLRNVSRDLDRLLGIDADPLGCADKIEELIGYVKNADSLIDQLPRVAI